MWGATAEGLGPWVWGIPIKTPPRASRIQGVQGGLGRFPFRASQKRGLALLSEGLGAGASRGLGLQGPPGPPGAGASRGLQTLQKRLPKILGGASRFWAVTSPFGQILGGSQLAPLPQGPHPQICCS